MNSQYFGGGPDTTNNREAYFPGFPVQANQTSTRRATSGSLRSTLGNDHGQRVPHRLRRRAGRVCSRSSSTPELWSGSVANQGGYYLNFAQSMGFTTNLQNS